MLEHGARSAVMEVSSHALSLKRVDAMRFGAGVFTNLTRDHLDFHEDMEAYFVAKRRLFEMLPQGVPGVINVDDPRGPSLVEICSRPVTYAVAARADVMSAAVDISLAGLRAEIELLAARCMSSQGWLTPELQHPVAATAAAVSLEVPDRRASRARAAECPAVRSRVAASRRRHRCRRLRAY
jgi:UDP-N-acetylmuramoyl-L-alanyl-D-glutamate--2,6-diaminopimelate ligase